ncbi:PadR family transcriptional regulator [Nocardioides sp. TF02-7]|uniref:PadR family transcriptional regulator n=1 Tax=Nocardioides sp. TF02-7 TaxID=2917724 RepID=UPI001F06F89B|nr:PadR family transcriptional regulator [Nocardioides sp. TF02-7]UMG94292.1 PadR family transcriptional regulator [Nocardioides sp. TF02-7]
MTHHGRFDGPPWLAGLANLAGLAGSGDCGPHHHQQHQHRPGPWGATWEGGHHHRRGGGPGGPPPWLAGLFGTGRPERGPRVRRGDVRSAILDVLRAAGEREESPNGYQVIQQITERSGGAWRPSPGSVYPTIQQLEDEGLVETDDERGRRALRLTEAGAAYCADSAEELADVWRPFERATAGSEGPGEHADIKAEIPQVTSAVWQIVTSGDDTQRRAAVEVLVEARRQLYGILADGPAPGRAGPGGPARRRVSRREVRGRSRG